MKDPKAHWEAIYQTKKPDEVSWTEEVPKTSLDFIHSFHVPKNAGIIDIGGGESKLVDCLINEGYENITVLDISEKALDKVKERLGEKAKKINWVVSDITEFNPEAKYAVWHDRATFHFLTTTEQIEKYLHIARHVVNGFMAIGTFSDNGPEKCSGLSVKQYNEEQLQAQLKDGFDKIRCITEDHITPFHTKQNFLFCSFKKHEEN